jgi:hypothetical protein
LLARQEKRRGSSNIRVVASAKPASTPKRRIEERKSPPAIGKTTVISYRRAEEVSPSKANTEKKKNSSWIILDGKTEITRPRVVVN